MAPLGTAGYWAALQSAVNAPGLPGGRISSLTQHHYTVDFTKSLVQGTDAIHCFTVDTQENILNSKVVLETAGELPSHCRHSLQELLSK